MEVRTASNTKRAEADHHEAHRTDFDEPEVAREVRRNIDQAHSADAEEGTVATIQDRRA